MKKYWKEILTAFALVTVIPWLTFGLLTREKPQNDTLHTTARTATENKKINVWHDDKMETMELSAYLTGVLLQEIPGNFHMEAKMAQAVVARTYTLRSVAVKNKHPMNGICTDSACCQAYCSPEAYLARGGSEDVVAQAREAVEKTDGMVLTYGGELIDATYFSCSGGQTEDAVAVWGNNIPYLQSVDSPGEENADHYTDEIIFTPEQFQTAIGRKLTGSPASWFGETLYTRGGGVAYMTVGGKTYDGVTLRSILGLRSTAFSVKVDNQNITFTSKGFGHRVGMSQYGADAMAESGKSWQEILLHYYTGTQISTLS